MWQAAYMQRREPLCCIPIEQSIGLLPSIWPPGWPPWGHRHLWCILDMQLCLTAGRLKALLQTQHCKATP